jgi:hypothetical protein
MSERFDIDHEVIHEYLRVGHSWVEIAEFVGTSTKTLRNWVVRANFVDRRLDPMSERFDIDHEVIHEYLRVGHSWVEIAEFVGTSTKTLRNWIVRANFVDRRLEFDPVAVDLIILKFVEEQGKIGETQIIGHVKGNFLYKGTRQEFRSSIRRTCEVELAARTSQFGRRVIRRVYTIKGPHKLWHLDGWHKLIRYRMVIFACIDGGTRALIYAGISNNNRASNHMR